MTKRVAELPEDKLIQTYFGRICSHLGDDCASIVVGETEQLLVSGDGFQEDVHFPRAVPAAWVAYKVVLAAVSDIVADGGRPRWLTLTLSLPRDLELSWLESFSEGLRHALQITGTDLIGGDTTAAVSHIGISLTAMGTVAKGRRITRAGAKPGDIIAVTGDLGEAVPGLKLILGELAMAQEPGAYWRRRHFHPPYRGTFGRRLADQGLASAMMDLSDGLAADLPRLCIASRVGAEIELCSVPFSSALECLGFGAEEALIGGEDFELLFTVPPDKWQAVQDASSGLDPRVTSIGTCVSGDTIGYKKDGEPFSLERKPWRHFG